MKPSGVPSRYGEAGVHLGLAERAMERIRPLVEATHGPEVAAGFGAFAGLWRMPGADGVLLGATIDGVGTKLRIAQATGRHAGVGVDIVNHCANDCMAAGARPAFFLDYFACGRLDPAVLAEIVRGMAEACLAARCALLGGETAEMPGFYGEEEYDLAGCMIGIAREATLPSAARVGAGDALLGYLSTGLHTNGYSLARHVLLAEMQMPLDRELPELGPGITLADALLAPHQLYVPALVSALDRGDIHALAHVTGGGIPGNLVRVLPPGLDARITPGSWAEPPIFDLIRRGGRVGEEEMRRVFNLGVGMIAVLDRAGLERAEADAQRHGIATAVIGEMVSGGGRVHFADDES